MKLSFVLITILFSLGCSLYESDARKFLREQGFVFSTAAKASLNSYVKKHCFSPPQDLSHTPSELEEGAWIENEDTDKTSIQYYSSNFSCLFEKNQPNSWSKEDYDLIYEIVSFAHDQRLTF